MDDAGVKDPGGEGLQAFQGIGRVGEDYVELLRAQGDEVEDVVAHHGEVAKAEPAGLRRDEGGVGWGHLHAPDVACAAGNELEGYRACATEEVQHVKAVELILIAKDVEKGLAGEVRGGSRLIACRGIYGLALEGSSDNPHMVSTDLK